MRAVYGWFGTLRKLLVPELCWFLWWGLFVAGFSSIWWYPTGRFPLYIWFVCLCVLGAIYADAWRERSLAVFVGLNGLIMSASLYIVYIKYIILMPEPPYEGMIVFAIGAGLPIMVPISYVVRLSKVLQYSEKK